MPRSGDRRPQIKAASVLVLSGVLATGALAGCSSSSGGGGSSSSPAVASSAQSTPNDIQSQDADAIVQASKTAATSASSVKVTGKFEQGSQQTSLDLELTKDGATGSMSQAGGSFEIIATADTIYIKGDDAFNSTFGGEAAKLLSGKWLSIPADNAQAQSFKGLAGTQGFFSEILTSDAKFTKTSETKDVNGVTCVGLTESGKGTLWIATTGEPYPMAIEAPQGQTGSLNFTDWNVPVTITPPPADQVVDVSKLQGSSAPATP